MPKIINTYKTIKSENLTSFDQQCTELYSKGWYPQGDIVVITMSATGEEDCIIYFQQWYETKTVED